MAVVGASGFWRWRFRGGVASRRVHGALGKYLRLARRGASGSRARRCLTSARARRRSDALAARHRRPTRVVRVALRQARRRARRFADAAFRDRAQRRRRRRRSRRASTRRRVRGGTSLLVVNRRANGCRARRVRSGAVGGAAPSATQPRLRDRAGSTLLATRRAVRRVDAATTLRIAMTRRSARAAALRRETW